ncbi:MAG: diguanylate cyclase [Hyphomicrobiales bacterium]
MRDYPLPDNEHDRLNQLESLRILDTLQEEAFNRITRIASHTLDMPIALVNFVGADQQWFKAKVGVDISQMPRDHGFCSHTICSNEILEINDATKDPRYADNPLVLGGPNVRFYAGAPLCVNNTYNLGTLSIIDTKPRSLSADERILLTDFAAMATELIELHQTTQRAIKAEERLIDAVETIPDGFVLFDKDDKLVMCNQRYKDIYSETAEYLLPGMLFSDMIRKGVECGQYPEAIGNEEAWIENRLERHRESNSTLEQQLPGDRWLRIQERRTSEGGMVGFRVDITQLKRQQRELSRLAWTDGLTNCLNRRRFVDLVNGEINRGQRSNTPGALILIDIDHFKKINDVFGHAAGDQVLVELVKRWNIELREYDQLARIGGEEFAILLPQCDDNGAELVVERLLKITSDQPIRVKGVDISITMSAGLIMFSYREDTVDTALARADEALYTAKRQGRNCYVTKAA